MLITFGDHNADKVTDSGLAFITLPETRALH